MKPVVLLCCLLALLASGARAQGWHPVTLDFNFTLEFPGDPVVSTLNGGKVLEYQSATGDAVAYWEPNKDSASLHTGQDIDNFYWDCCKDFCNITYEGSKITDTLTEHMQCIKAFHFSLKYTDPNSGAITYHSFHIAEADNNFYVFEYSYPLENKVAAREEKASFFGSIQMAAFLTAGEQLTNK